MAKKGGQATFRSYAKTAAEAAVDFKKWYPGDAEHQVVVPLTWVGTHWESVIERTKDNPPVARK